ncbi:MAG: hypothetical protein HONBIEJF_02537 [Fimbriimonadaceae bacterium]|nr:hypothetical protein [Fimbriimonadaceae bacterium]
MPTVTYASVNGRIWAEKRGGTRRVTIGDPLGNVRALASSTGSLAHRYTYWPYGAVRTGDASQTSQLYSGTLGPNRDSSTRTHMGVRELLVGVGRWSSRDPFFPGELPYSYAACSPTRYIDPNGNQVEAIWAGGAAGGAVGGPVGAAVGIILVGSIVLIGGAIAIDRYNIRPFEVPITATPPCPEPPKDPCPPWLVDILHSAYHVFCDKRRSCKGLQVPKDCPEIWARTRNGAICLFGRRLWIQCYPSRVTIGHLDQVSQVSRTLNVCLDKAVKCLEHTLW